MIHWRVENNIGYIKIESPNKNALGVEDLSRLIKLLDNDVHDCRGIIITGSGYSFCSGLDLSEDLNHLLQLLDKVLSLLHNLSMPVVCALNGHAVGAGFLIVCCADYIVSVKNDRAKYGLPELKHGITITDFMFSVLLNKMHKSSVKKMLFSLELVDANELSKLGLLNKVCNTNESLLKESSDYILKLENHSLEAFIKTKQLFLR